MKKIDKEYNSKDVLSQSEQNSHESCSSSYSCTCSRSIITQIFLFFSLEEKQSFMHPACQSHKLHYSSPKKYAPLHPTYDPHMYAHRSSLHALHKCSRSLRCIINSILPHLSGQSYQFSLIKAFLLRQ